MNLTNQQIDAFRTALDYVRSHYGDGFGDRCELSGDMARFSREDENVPFDGVFGSEAVLQPILRYQQIPAEDVFDQIQRKVGDASADVIAEMLIRFADARASRHDTESDK